MTRKTITPSQVELLRDCLQTSGDSVTVYFQVMQGDSPFADYVAEIMRRDASRFDYTVGGHGIGNNTRDPVSLDSTVERVLQDNERFNAGGSFTFEFV